MTKPTNTLEHNYSDGSELIPAEVAAKKQREDSEPLNNSTSNNNYTVDREGLINNYPITPPLQGAEYPTPREKFAYLILGGIAAIFVMSLIFIAIQVS